MFLRSIQIRGFKSFADSTVLDFIPGVSVIVGPNGSGKSNLVDAIAWALGEQGPRALRGGQMADVIFAGTPTRPALGMAEVKLVIDNAAGKIPVPMSEIEISRTIFRSGDSEYRINGRAVRLMDVLELLSESGIGRALHTVVGQGQLEEVLLARPEERRKYIEEAAGIAKHRRRKERAERKLSGLDQDLLRLQDVLAELRRQLKPLRQQAEMASKHERLAAEADELSSKLAAARLRALLREQDRRRGGWDEGRAIRAQAREALERLDVDVLAAADARAAAAQTLAESEQAFRAAAVDKERDELGFREAIEGEAAAREALASEASRAARVDAVDAELRRVDAELHAVLEELESEERRLEEAEASFRAAEDERRAIEEIRRRLGEQAATRRAELETLRDTLGTAEREGDRVEASIAGVRERVATLEEERAECEAEIERLDGQSSPLGDRRAQLEDERRHVVERVEELEEAERRMAARRDLLDARRRDIEETPGSRFLAAHRGRVVGLVRDLVRAEPGLEPALLSALGPLADAVVYEDGERALHDAGEGEGAILAISAGGPVPFELARERSLLSAVHAEPAARGIVSTVLKDVYLADDLQEAAAKQIENPAVSFVTPDGVLVGPAVIHTARRVDDRARELRAERQVVEHDLAATRNALRPRRQRLNELAQEIDFLQGQIEASDAEITGAAERLAALERDLAALLPEEDLLRQRAAALDDNVAVWRERLAATQTAAEEPPELPPPPQLPIGARVAVETLRRTR